MNPSQNRKRCEFCTDRPLGRARDVSSSKKRASIRSWGHHVPSGRCDAPARANCTSRHFRGADLHCSGPAAARTHTRPTCPRIHCECCVGLSGTCSCSLCVFQKIGVCALVLDSFRMPCCVELFGVCTVLDCLVRFFLMYAVCMCVPCDLCLRASMCTWKTLS